MKIFAAGIATETNTFCPVPTSLADFQIQRGSEVLSGHITHPSLDLSVVWGEQARLRGDTFVFSLMAWAAPSGITVRAAYESLRDELLADLRTAMPIDVVLLNLHGAMVAYGYDDCEEDLIEHVRTIVGPEAIIGVELDLHCHLSEAKIASADIVVTYKEYPHVDMNERAREIFDLAIASRLGECRPITALFECRMVGLYPTTREPLSGFVAAMKEAEQRDGVLSVSFGHGFQFGDVPHVGAKVLVVTDDDPGLAQRTARELGLRVYGMRRDMGFESLAVPLEEALCRAINAVKTPIVVADQSDNTGGGAPGDSTFALRWLMEHQASDAALALLYDPEAVRIAHRAGPGARLSIRLGGKLSVHSGQPIDLDVTVLAVREHYRQPLPQQSGEPWYFSAGDVAALRCDGVDIVVSSERCQCFSPAVFSDLGINPATKRVLVVKSIQHFYAGFAPIAAEVIYMAAPGAVAPDPRLVAYRRVNTERLYPWVADPLSL